MSVRRRRIGLALLAALLLGASPPPRPIVIVDTDIGDDIDDAYALTWALRSRALDVRLVTTSFGDTALRARMVRRLLTVLGRTDVAAGAGPATAPATAFTQANWAAEGSDDRGDETDAVTLALDLIRANPGRVTLIALAPLTSLGAMIARDPRTFATLGGVLMMGGSIGRGYDKDGAASPIPDAEWNIAKAPSAFRALLASGAPVTLFPLDSTQVRPDHQALSALTDPKRPVTAMLGTLTRDWAAANPWHQTLPTLFDAVPVAAAIDPALCPTIPMRIAVDDGGFTRREAGPSNVRACLKSDAGVIIRRLTAAVR